MIINRKELLAALQIANKVVPKSSSMPILATVQIDGKSATMQATDLETGVEIPLEIPRTAEKYTLSAHRLTDIVRSLDADDVEIKVMDGDDIPENWVNINGLFEIAGFPADEFPRFEIPETTGYVTVEKKALQNVIPAVTREEAGFKLSGVYFDTEQGKCVATDGHRLHMEPINAEGGSIMIGDKALNVVISSLGKNEDEITLKTDAKRVIEREASDPPDEDILEGLKKSQLNSLADDYFGLRFDNKDKVDDIREELMAEMQRAAEPVYSETARAVVVKTEKATFAMRPMEARFPDYIQVFPEKTAHTVTIKRGDFLPAINQALTMANETYKAVKLTFNGKGTIEMESVNPDVGTYQRLTVPMTGHVDPAMEAGFNPSYLKAIMEITKDDDAEFEVGVNSNNLPLTFNYGSFEGLVMPMRV